MKTYLVRINKDNAKVVVVKECQFSTTAVLACKSDIIKDMTSKFESINEDKIEINSETFYNGSNQFFEVFKSLNFKYLLESYYTMASVTTVGVRFRTESNVYVQEYLIICCKHFHLISIDNIKKLVIESYNALCAQYIEHGIICCKMADGKDGEPSKITIRVTHDYDAEIDSDIYKLAVMINGNWINREYEIEELLVWDLKKILELASVDEIKNMLKSR